MLHIKRYNETDKDSWNQFVSESKNGTFLFNSQKEIENSQAKNKMISIWSEILLQRKIYYNPLYLENKY